ncbi:MAG: VOC family protein [Myxococcota bacterium]|nr:VOC family protein [Myxococcota bacterium]
MSAPGGPLRLDYVNLYVGDLERSLAFFRDTLGLAVQYEDRGHGYASLEAGPIRMGLAQVDLQDEKLRGLVGRQTGIGFAVDDLTACHGAWVAKGVHFSMEPARQPWGAVMAMFEDPDGNVFYLDERR